jgi:hypothetical protein
MIDNFLPIPDAESLPLYRMALNLLVACVCVNKAASFHYRFQMILDTLMLL